MRSIERPTEMIDRREREVSEMCQRAGRVLKQWEMSLVFWAI